MSPRPRPPGRGGPSPRSRCTVPCSVPAGIRIRFVPFRVGTSTVAPRIASAIVIGTVTSRLPSERCLKTGDGVTRVVTENQPGEPARGPASPLPASRIRVPSWTPGGMLTR